MPDPIPSPAPPPHEPPVRDPLAEGGEMQQEPRGGWRFADPAEQEAHGAQAALPPLTLPHRPDPFAPRSREDEARAAFAGDAQNPAHGHLGSGTWGTWAGPVPDAPEHA